MHTAEEPVGHSPAPLHRPRAAETVRGHTPAPDTDRGTTHGLPGRAGSRTRYPDEHPAVVRVFATR
ncbi:hypothetical protein ACFWFF_02295 [Streptomyces sp. NPDC060223]|uniref:hypothetical protein n=1 Tax=unclassified Streptomyces TaxID=2593676 RepID=UPI00364244FD